MRWVKVRMSWTDVVAYQTTRFKKPTGSTCLVPNKITVEYGFWYTAEAVAG